MIRRVKWACPNGHPAVLGPSRPRALATCRFCLVCSADTPKLVLRVAPTLERERSAATERKKASRAKREERTANSLAAYYHVHGVDLREELAKILRAPSAAGLRRNPPEIIVRTRSVSKATHGRAYYDRHEILINRLLTGDAAEVRDTLTHEVAHFLARGKGHGIAWKTAFRVLSEEVYGIRPIIDTRFGGPLAVRLRTASPPELSALQGFQEGASL